MTFRKSINKIRMVWAWLRPVLKGHALDVMVILLPIAKDAILEQVGKPIDNTAKKSEAMSTIYALLARLGYQRKDLSQHLIEMGFNIAFQKLRDENRV